VFSFETCISNRLSVCLIKCLPVISDISQPPP